MSTSSLIAATPAATWAISRSFGPRTAATMQNSVAPVFAVCLAASTSDGTSSHAERTGESNRPDWEQKWQSSGQPPVFSEMMPSTSTSGPHQRIRTSWASSSSASSAVVWQPQHLEDLRLVEADTPFEHLLAGGGQDGRPRESPLWSSQLGSLPFAAERGPETVTRDGREIGRRRGRSRRRAARRAAARR